MLFFRNSHPRLSPFAGDRQAGPEEALTAPEHERARYRLLSRCVDHLGGAGFYEPFLALVAEVIGADQCMAFAYHPTGATCLLSRNFLETARGAGLHRAYLAEGFRADPLRPRLEAMTPGAARLVPLAETIGEMSAGYRARYYEAPGLADKLAVLLVDQTRRLIVNFYRGAGRPRFGEEHPPLPPGLVELAAHLFRAHLAARPSGGVPAPLAALSERERQVCAGILAGRKTEAIAGQCGIAPNSVVTYRRRAYVKLGISSRAGLFALCAPQLSAAAAQV
ncbi:MAG: helix-turn-helix transcriptional regulator [Rhodospirillales bacterium]|nr:helix-turn-helix transcriptional regulator [Rhodospirillales bacterium]MDE2575787.1 helix-turn-helix transcriptional regulator [Rhodospirillales bacterium]